MNTLLSRAGLGTCAIAAIIGAAYGKWEVETMQLRRQTMQRFGENARCMLEDLTGLPAPVARYFAYALTPGQWRIRSARVQQKGHFAMRPNTWLQFSAVEYFSANPRSFLWDAQIWLAPMLPILVRDRYREGFGEVCANLAAVMPLGCCSPKGDLAAASLLRFLAEAALMPTALLPSESVIWKAIDKLSAWVTLTDSGITVSCKVFFNAENQISRMEMERGRQVRGEVISTPWVATWHDYRRIKGMMVPTYAEVAWILPEGPFPYWQGQLTNFSFDQEQ